MIHNYIKYSSIQMVDKEESIKSIENNMSPRFGHTITLSKYSLLILNKHLTI